MGKKQYELFLEWCQNCGMEYKLTLQAFGLRLKRLNFKGIQFGKHSNKGESRIFNIALLKEELKLNDIAVENN